MIKNRNKECNDFREAMVERESQTLYDPTPIEKKVGEIN